MSPAILALLALLAAIVLSVATRLNVGVIAVALAWLVGIYAAHLKPDEIVQGFPATLFVTLAGVALLFGIAETNGTLDVVTHRAVGLAQGQVRWLPIFFVLASIVSSAGPGAVPAVALLAPIAMAVAIRAEVPTFLMALMVANGANAGNLSPVSAVGVIANTKMAEAGLGGHEVKVWFANFASHVLVATVAYVGLGGFRLAHRPVAIIEAPTRLVPRHWLTLAVIVTWIVGVVGFKFPVGLSAFAAAAILFAARSADDGPTIKGMPWGVIVMVCGVSVLIGVLERTGGMDLFTGLLARIASAKTVNGVIAFVTGTISTYSSTSGVVLPAFLPTAPGLVAKVGGGDPLAVALSINVGSSLVDVSPLSTLGALCIAAVADPTESRRLFYRLLGWGVAMTVVGALLCQLFAGPLARA